MVGALGGGELADGFACKFRDYIDANTALGDGRGALALLAGPNLHPGCFLLGFMVFFKKYVNKCDATRH